MDSSSGILTLQLGNKANYVGTCFWNSVQQGIDAEFELESNQRQNGGVGEERESISIRPGSLLYSSVSSGNLNTLRLVPRAIMMDSLDGVTSALRKVSSTTTSTAKARNTVSTWKGGVQVLSGVAAASRHDQEQEMALVDALDSDGHMEGTVRSWPDFLDFAVHPSSLSVFKQPIISFDAYETGIEVWRAESLEVLDKCRRMVEECDSFGGVQCFYDSGTGWGGVAGECLKDIYDDFRPPSSVCLSISSNSNSSSISSPSEKAMAQKTVSSLRELYTLTDIGALWIPTTATIAMGSAGLDWAAMCAMWYDTILKPVVVTHTRNHKSASLAELTSALNGLCRISLPMLSLQSRSSHSKWARLYSMGHGLQSEEKSAYSNVILSDQVVSRMDWLVSRGVVITSKSKSKSKNSQVEPEASHPHHYHHSTPFYLPRTFPIQSLMDCEAISLTVMDKLKLKHTPVRAVACSASYRSLLPLSSTASSSLSLRREVQPGVYVQEFITSLLDVVKRRGLDTDKKRGVAGAPVNFSGGSAGSGASVGTEEEEWQQVVDWLKDVSDSVSV